MEEEARECYNKARSISDKVLKYAKSLKFENSTALSIAETIERLIIDNKGKPAWPVNVCVNEIAAHYSPIDASLVLKEGDLVKIDFGVQVKGYIWDQAFTVCVGKDSHPLIEASEKALEKAVKSVKKGTRVFELSEVIEETVSSFGVRVVKNLCGHGLDRYVVHAKPSIPNTKNNIQEEIQDQAIAIEVFVTNGSGWVKESEPPNIFSFKEDKPVRLWEARKILEQAKVDFEGLPFSPRWIKNVSGIKMEMAIKELLEANAIVAYPPLKEESGGLVAVAETTLLVE
jgi:methionyl aminopeptidase